MTIEGDADHFGGLLGLEHRPSAPDTASIEIALRPHHANRFGTVHGGVVMALMDAAGLWAGASAARTPPRASTVSVTCNFVRAVRVDEAARLVAQARIVKRGRSLYFSSIEILAGPQGPVIASGQGIYAVAA
jgi:uncharacterized protein (TIGR00369 family)